MLRFRQEFLDNPLSVVFRDFLHAFDVILLAKIAFGTMLLLKGLSDASYLLPRNSVIIIGRI